MNFHAHLVLSMLLTVKIEPSLEKERWSQGRDRFRHVLHTEHTEGGLTSVYTLCHLHTDKPHAFSKWRGRYLWKWTPTWRLSRFCSDSALSYLLSSAFVFERWFVCCTCAHEVKYIDKRHKMRWTKELCHPNSQTVMKTNRNDTNVLFEAICIGMKSVGWRAVPIFRLHTAGTLEKALPFPSSGFTLPVLLKELHPPRSTPRCRSISYSANPNTHEVHTSFLVSSHESKIERRIWGEKLENVHRFEEAEESSRIGHVDQPPLDSILYRADTGDKRSCVERKGHCVERNDPCTSKREKGTVVYWL